MRSLPRIVADTEVGKSVSIEIWRNNKMIFLEAKVEELDDATEVASRTTGDKQKGKESLVKKLGLKLSSITPGLRDKYSLDKDAKGVIVIKVEADGPAAEKGIRPGDVIVEISQQEASGPSDVAKKVAEAEKAGRKSVLLLLEGQSGLRFVAVRIDKS